MTELLHTAGCSAPRPPGIAGITARYTGCSALVSMASLAEPSSMRHRHGQRIRAGRTVLLSGDVAPTVAQIAADLGVGDFRAEQSPEAKPGPQKSCTRTSPAPRELLEQRRDSERASLACSDAGPPVRTIDAVGVTDVGGVFATQTAPSGRPRQPGRGGDPRRSRGRLGPETRCRRSLGHGSRSGAGPFMRGHLVQPRDAVQRACVIS